MLVERPENGPLHSPALSGSGDREEPCSKFVPIRNLNVKISTRDRLALYRWINVVYRLDTAWKVPSERTVFDLNADRIKVVKHAQKDDEGDGESVREAGPPKAEENEDTMPDDEFSLLAMKKALTTMRDALRAPGAARETDVLTVLTADDFNKMMKTGCFGIQTTAIAANGPSPPMIIRGCLDSCSVERFSPMYKETFASVRWLADPYLHSAKPPWYAASLRNTLVKYLRAIDTVKDESGILSFREQMNSLLRSLRSAVGHFQEWDKTSASSFALAAQAVTQIAYLEETSLHTSPSSAEKQSCPLMEILENPWNVYSSTLKDWAYGELPCLDRVEIRSARHSDRFCAIVNEHISKTHRIATLTKLLAKISNKHCLLLDEHGNVSNRGCESGSASGPHNEASLRSAERIVSLTVRECLRDKFNEKIDNAAEMFFDKVTTIGKNYTRDWNKKAPVEDMMGHREYPAAGEPDKDLNRVEQRLLDFGKSIDARLKAVNNALVPLLVVGSNGILAVVRCLCDLCLLQGCDMSLGTADCLRDHLMQLEVNKELTNPVVAANFRMRLNEMVCTVGATETLNLRAVFDVMRCYCARDGLDFIAALSLHCEIPIGLRDIIDLSPYNVCYRLRTKLLYTSLVMHELLLVLRTKDKARPRFHRQFLLINQHRFEMSVFVRCIRNYTELSITEQLSSLKSKIDGLYESCTFEKLETAYSQFVTNVFGRWVGSGPSEESSFNTAVSTICQNIVEYSLAAQRQLKTPLGVGLDTELLKAIHEKFKKHLTSFLCALRVFVIDYKGEIMRPLLLALDFNRFYKT